MHGSFESTGTLIDRETKEALSGGMVCGFWGTELGARRDQALIAWDYNADFVFLRLGASTSAACGAKLPKYSSRRDCAASNALLAASSACVQPDHSHSTIGENAASTHI